MTSNVRREAIRRDFNGEIMNQRDMILAKSNLYSKGQYMKPLQMSNALKVNKADLWNKKVRKVDGKLGKDNLPKRAIYA